MKKIFFIVLFLFLTINSFSVDFKAEVFGAFNFLDYDDEPGMGGGERGRIRFEADIKKENYGGWARLDISGGLQGSPVGIYGYVFYRPFDYLSLYVTRNPDGHFDLCGNALWNFYGTPGDVTGMAFDSSYTGSFSFNFDDEDIYGIPGYNNAFYSGFTNGAFITFNHEKAKDLTINWGFPVFDNLTASEMIKFMTLQVTYNIGKIGLIGLTYSGLPNTQIEDIKPDEVYTGNDPWNKSAVLRAYWRTEISGINLDLGAGYMLPEKNAGNERNYPISIGAAAAFDVSKVNIKTRTLFTGFGSYKYNGVTYKSPLDFRFDILPSMPLTDKITGYLNTGFIMNNPDNEDAQTGWSIFPFITVGDKDSYAFYTGFELVYMEDVYFRIPFGIRITFR